MCDGWISLRLAYVFDDLEQFHKVEMQGKKLLGGEISCCAEYHSLAHLFFHVRIMTLLPLRRLAVALSQGVLVCIPVNSHPGQAGVHFRSRRGTFQYTPAYPTPCSILWATHNIMAFHSHFRGYLKWKYREYRRRVCRRVPGMYPGVTGITTGYIIAGSCTTSH